MTRRQVGVEIEFSGIPIEDAVQTLEHALDASTDAVSEHEFLLHAKGSDDPYRVEVDFELLKRLSRDEQEQPDQLRRTVVDVLGAAASIAVPLELVTPPLPLPALDDLDRICAELASQGAVGTQESFAYAFGVHFNPNVAEPEAASIVAHLQAFSCLFEWLKARDEMDLTRRLTSFADPYPKDYELLVLDDDYRPDEPQLIDDYLQHNPTRNRALDMLPLFAHLDEDRVKSALDDPRIKSRPTFHYRLPNCRLGDDGWSLLDPWRGWLEVERLAAAPEALSELASARRRHLEAFTIGATDEWIATCERTIRNLVSA